MRPAPVLRLRKHARHRRQVADVAVDHAEQRDDRGLVGGDRVEIAHQRFRASGLSRLSLSNSASSLRP